MGKSILFFGAAVLILGCTLVCAPPAVAYETYLDGGTNCSECHPTFQSFGSLHGLHLGFTSECNLCHITTPGATPVPTHEDPPANGFVGCVGCHGRDPGTGSGVDWAAGLRLHHTNDGAPPDETGQTCLDCHDTDPLPQPEDVVPLYYGTADTTQTDPCADNLDNDGDLLYDGDDPDCQPGCTSNADCSDGIFCNGTETCNTTTGDCEAGTPPDCDDGVGCTDDSCDPTADACVNDPNDANCPDDGMFCNGTEFCDEADDCSSTGDPCPPGEICNDTDDICEPIGCTVDADCDDGLFCNGAESCNTSTNECEAGTPPDCSDGVGCTVDSCNEGTDSCDNVPDDTSCDNGLFCDGAEFCDPVLDCQAGTPPDCDDGVGCTDDFCDATSDACANVPNDANCPDDGVFCNGTEYCDPAVDCSSTGDPCPPGEICNEVQDICELEDGPVEVEIEVPGAINARNRGKTPIHIEFPDSDYPESNGGTEVEIAELYCGGDVSDAMATPWRINAEDDEEYEFVALYKTSDLMLVCEDTMMICAGTLVDGTLFIGMDDLRVIRDADGRCGGGGGWNGGKKNLLPRQSNRR